MIDRFEILSLAGSGGMGKVFLARDRTDGCNVALKILHEGVEGDMVRRFQRETDALARLDHAAIVSYRAHGVTDEGMPFLAMEWVDGEELRARLKREGTLSVAEVVTLARRIGQALGHAHERGILHRDIKPSNVILPGGDITRAMLIDFGLARAGDDDLTQTGMLVGTPAYMAPEQIRGEALAPSVDVFGLGCVLYQCLAQTSPFSANGTTATLTRVLFGEPVPLSLVAPHVPARIGDVILAMLSKQPNGRPSMQDVVRTLDDPRAPLQKAAPRLSSDEQRVVSVIIASVRRGDDANETLRFAATPLDFERLWSVAEQFQAELTRLPNGALIAILESRGTATDLAARAADCALALKRELGDTPVSLATGRAQTGGLPIGEAIDRAIDLPSYAGPAVRIDDVTDGLLDQRFDRDAEKAGIVLRGQSSAKPRVRTLLGQPTPCVGRDAEIMMLEGLLAQSADESVARAILMTGAAGAGKSRILQELLARAPREAWVTHGDSMGAKTPFGMIARIVRAEAGVLAHDDAITSQQKLRARVARCAEPDRVASFLGEIAGVHFPDDVQLRAAKNDPRLMGDQIQRAFLDFIDAECARHPVVIVLEDLQWGDPPTMKAIDAALKMFAERPLAVIALARPEVHTSFPDLWAERALTRLTLAPLPKRAAAQLVRVLFPAKDDKATSELVEKASGNVFMLEELLRAEAEGRGREAPATVVAMVQSRLSALDTAARRVLRAASILGDSFSRDGVSALLGDDARDLNTSLDVLVRAEVFDAQKDGYAFRQALVRESAYAMLTDEDRTLGHRLAAEWSDARGAPALVIASHWERARERERAAALYLRAAEQALSSDLAGAIEHAEHGVRLGASGELLGALRNVQAQAYHWQGITEKMETCAAEAVALLGRDDMRRADALTILAVAKQRLGHTAELTSVAEHLSEMLNDCDADRSALARAGGRVASLLFFAGKHETASAMLDAAERAAKGCGVDVAARIHQARAPHARLEGRPEAALRHLEAAHAAYERAGDRRNACMMAGIRGYALTELGANEEAAVALCDALHTAEHLGLTAVAASCRTNIGVPWLRLGRLAEAEASVRKGIVAFASNDQRFEGGSRVYLSMILRDKGELEEAEREARAAVVLFDAAPALRPLAGGVLATILLAQNRANDALEASRDAMEGLDRGANIEEGEALIRLAFVRSLLTAGNERAAHEALVIARDRLMARAETIETKAFRRTFLEAIPEHTQTLALTR